MSGNVEFLSGGKISVAQGNKSTYYVFNEKDIDPNTLSVSDGKIDFFINRGAEAELHYGDGKSHKFNLDPMNERNFYLDQDKNEVVFVDEGSCEGNDCAESTTSAFGGNSKCWAWVIGVPWKYTSGCCNSDHSHDAWALVGYNSEWRVSSCCPDLHDME